MNWQSPSFLASCAFRVGGYYLAQLEPRRRSKRALVAAVQEAYTNGVSTRRVDDLVKAFGLSRMSKSHISRLCEAFAAKVDRFGRASLTAPMPTTNRTPSSSKSDKTSVTMAAAIAVGVNQDGHREVLVLD